MKKKTMTDGKMKKEIKVYIFNIKIKRRGFVLIIKWYLYLFFFSVYWGFLLLRMTRLMLKQFFIILLLLFHCNRII